MAAQEIQEAAKQSKATCSSVEEGKQYLETEKSVIQTQQPKLNEQQCLLIEKQYAKSKQTLN